MVRKYFPAPSTMLRSEIFRPRHYGIGVNLLTKLTFLKTMRKKISQKASLRVVAKPIIIFPHVTLTEIFSSAVTNCQHRHQLAMVQRFNCWTVVTKNRRKLAHQFISSTKIIYCMFKISQLEGQIIDLNITGSCRVVTRHARDRQTDIQTDRWTALPQK